MPAPAACLDECTHLELVDALRLFLWGHLQQQLERGLRIPGYSEDEVRDALRRV